MSKKIHAVPKPASTKKSKKKGTTKTVNMDAVEERKKNFSQQGRRNKNFGRQVENNVAKITGGERVPMSGAIKTSTYGMVGDVRIRYKGKTLFLIEVKGTSGINPKGDKTFSLKKSVLDQADDEARQVGALPAVWVHWLNANYEQDDYVILPARAFLDILDMYREEIDDAERDGQSDSADGSATEAPTSTD